MNEAFRLEEKVLEKMDKKNERATPLELLGGVYEKAGEVFAPISGDLSKAAFHWSITTIDIAMCQFHQIMLPIDFVYGIV